MPSITTQIPMIMATRPHVGMPKSWASLSAISIVFSLIFSASLSVGAGPAVVDPSYSAKTHHHKFIILIYTNCVYSTNLLVDSHLVYKTHKAIYNMWNKTIVSECVRQYDTHVLLVRGILDYFSELLIGREFVQALSIFTKRFDNW